MSTLSQINANRANAQLSSGPTSAGGKAKCSLNAVKTGLTGRTVLLPSEDAEAYETHLLQYLERFAPIGERETELVQSLADTQWRLNRIPGLEFGLFALGRKRYAELFEEETDTQVSVALLDAHILMTEAKHFKNLHLQESRLRRQYRQDVEELRALQGERKQKQEEEEKQASIAQRRPVALAASANGFEFTNAKKPHNQATTGPKSAPKQTVPAA
ncbi:MAG: hypothetical protein JO028_13240 [Acidobacteriaceae bacterium]|nr:hypothetical protein [Acidobacteriaceae bacterium]